MVQYELGSEGLSLSRLFARMEEAQRDLQVEDYSVSQNNLDNVSGAWLFVAQAWIGPNEDTLMREDNDSNV